MVISKKVAKLSVDRHTLKRRIVAAALPWCSETRALVIYARPGSAALPFPALKEELEALLIRTLGPIR